MNNIIKRTWNQNRMVQIEDLTGSAFQSESGGHTFEISGIDDTGAAVSLSGTVEGRFIRPDGAQVTITGTASGGKASVTLTDTCYAVAGRFIFIVFVTSGGQKTAVYSCVGVISVASGTAGGSVPPLVADSVQTNTLDVTDDATVGGDLTVGGVLDVTQRRCYGELQAPTSSGKWYRIMTISSIGIASYPWAVDITIGRIYVSTYQSEVHKLTLFATYNKFSFLDENGQSNDLEIDKIRYVRNGTTGYIDVHYKGTVQNTAYATFVVHTDYNHQSSFASNNFEAVADAPTADSIVTYDLEHYDKGLSLISSPNLAVGGNTPIPNLWRYKTIIAYCNTDTSDPIDTRCVAIIPKLFTGQFNVPVCTQTDNSYFRVQVTDTALYFTASGISGMKILKLYGIM